MLKQLTYMTVCTSKGRELFCRCEEDDFEITVFVRFWQSKGYRIKAFSRWVDGNGRSPFDNTSGT